MMTQEQVTMIPTVTNNMPTGVGPISLPPPVANPAVSASTPDYVTRRLNNSSGSSAEEVPCALERDYYGCYCLKFIVKNGTHITEEKVMEDFGSFGDVVDVRGPGLFSGLRGNHVYVRFIDRQEADQALKQLNGKYHQLTPASISDVLPDNYGLYTISFYNKTGIPSCEVRREFSKFGEVKNLTGSLDVKGGRVFVSYKNKESAVQALQAFFFRKDRYPNMKFALPRCEKDYFGCYCLKFYNKTGEITYDKVLEEFGQYGEVVDIRGPGLFDVTGDDVYVRYKEKSSAEQALIELVGKYDSLCLAPPSDIQADKFGYYTITFVNDKCLSKSDVWYIFSKFGTVACVNGTFDCKKGRVFVSYKEKQGALSALETMLITKEYHLQVSKNSTVRKNDYNVVNAGKDTESNEFDGVRHERANSEQRSLRERSGSREASCGPPNHRINQLPPPPGINTATLPPGRGGMPPPTNAGVMGGVPEIAGGLVSPQGLIQVDGVNGLAGHHQSHHHPPHHPPHHPHGGAQAGRMVGGSQSSMASASHHHHHHHNHNHNNNNGSNNKNGLVKFNRNVEKDIFGYYCLSFLNEDGEISEKKVRTDFSKFGEVVSVRGALGKQKGHVFVRFRKKEAAENCLNCLNSFPLSEMSELFGRYLFLSPATPRDIDCDMYGFYSISFLNLNNKSFRDIRGEFSKFGEILRMVNGGGGNTDELVTISYSDKAGAVRALQTHFTNKDYPYLDIAKGSSLLLVNSSDSSDCEEHDLDYHLQLQHRDGTVPPALSHPTMPPPAAPQQQGAVNSMAPNDRCIGPGGHALAGGGAGGGGVVHDPFSKSLVGSDVVDELLKPLQSYFNVFRTGLYDNSHHHQHHHQNNMPGGGPVMAGGQQGSGGPVINAQQVDPAELMNGRDGPAHNTRSHDKRYKSKKVVAGGGGLMDPSMGPPPAALGPRGKNMNGVIQVQNIIPPQETNGLPPPPHHHHHMTGGPPPHPMVMQPPPAATSLPNGYVPTAANSVPAPPAGTSMLENMETEISHHGPRVVVPSAAGMSEPPPTLLGNGVGGVNNGGHGSAPPPYPPPGHHPLLMLPPGNGGGVTAPPPPPSMLSPAAAAASQQPMGGVTGPMSPVNLVSGVTLERKSSQEALITAHHQQQSGGAATAVRPEDEDRLEVDLSNMSIQESTEPVDQSSEETCVSELDLTTQVPASVPATPNANTNNLTKDVFGFYSLSFLCKSKDLSERRVRLDFGLVAEVSRVRGLCGRVDTPIIVSFTNHDDAMACYNDKALLSKYPSLQPAGPLNVIPDKDGYFSIEFVNTGMSGVREITNEFSRHGELVKVHQGGAKNAVKRVTVSYTDAESAMRALEAYANSKDVRGIDFVIECLDVRH